MKILVVSDVEIGFIYSPGIKTRFPHVDFVISCGDLPYYYLEYIISMLDKPLYYVRGNHAYQVEITTGGDRREPWGAVNLHQRTVRDPTGVLLAGIEGSIRYNNGPQQYSQGEMWAMVINLIPRLLFNRLRFGRYLDILVTHSPPWQIHDKDDPPHRGIRAFRWLIKVFKPAFHLHGHIHVYRQDTITQTAFGDTQVINTYGYREIEFMP